MSRHRNDSLLGELFRTVRSIIFWLLVAFVIIPMLLVGWYVTGFYFVFR